MVAQFERRIAELEQQLSQREQQKTKANSASGGKDLKLRWRERKRTPCKMYRYCDAVIDGNTVYIRNEGTVNIYAYDVTSDSWSQLPNDIHRCGSLAVINGWLTAVGGGFFTTYSNELFSLTGEGNGRKWTKKFPPMITKRCCATALCTETTLIVAGGEGEGGVLSTIEVMNTETHQWSAAADLPQPMRYASAALCGDQLYILCGLSRDIACTRFVYTCSVSALLQSCAWSPLEDKPNVWSRVADLPVIHSTCESFHGRLLAVGGKMASLNATKAVYMYNSTANSWEIISHMTTGHWNCFTAVLPDNQLMVVGGTTDGGWSDTVEIASVCT